MYAQDSWTLARRLTLNLGVRYAHENKALPEQCRVAAAPPLDVVFPAECFPEVQFKIWNSVVPRLHAVYDFTGDGRTVIKGGWGRFAHLRYVDEIQMANENAHTLALFRWHDLNGNKLYDPGEMNLDRNGPDFLFTRLEVGETDAGAVPNPNEKQPITDEFSLSVERELIRDFAVRVTGVYSRNINTYRLQNNLRPYGVYSIPITNADPGPDGREWDRRRSRDVHYVLGVSGRVGGARLSAAYARQRSHIGCELQERRGGGEQTPRQSMDVHGVVLGHQATHPVHP